MKKLNFILLFIAIFCINSITFSQSCVELEIINVEGDTLQGFTLLPQTEEIRRLKINTDVTKTVIKLLKGYKPAIVLYKTLLFSSKIKEELGYDDKGKKIAKRIPYIINTETIKLSISDIRTIKLLARKTIHLPEYEGSLIEVSPDLAQQIAENPLINSINHSTNFTLDLESYCALFYNFNPKINQEQLQLLAKKYKAFILPESYDEKTKKTIYFDQSKKEYWLRKEKAVNELSAKGIAFCVYYCGD